MSNCCGFLVFQSLQGLTITFLMEMFKYYDETSVTPMMASATATKSNKPKWEATQTHTHAHILLSFRTPLMNEWLNEWMERHFCSAKFACMNFMTFSLYLHIMFSVWLTQTKATHSPNDPAIQVRRNYTNMRNYRFACLPGLMIFIYCFLFFHFSLLSFVTVNFAFGSYYVFKRVTPV